MKGRRVEPTRFQLHQQLIDYLGVNKIYSEYGMTELFSQFYSKGDGFFNQNSRLRAFVRDVKDPFSVSSHGIGALNLIDLANIDSVCFIATSDQTKIDGNQLEIIGRIDHTDQRGCSLMVL
jgi:hypothetical protein